MTHKIAHLIVAVLVLLTTRSEAQVFFIDSETASYIDAAAFSPGNNVILFFSGSALTIYDITAEELTETVWYDLGEIEKVDAALSWDDDIVLLFEGNNYWTFEASTATFLSGPDQWLGLPNEWKGSLDAAVRWSEDEVMFFKDDQFVVFNFVEDSYSIFDDYTTWANWPEKWITGLEAVFNLGGEIYFLNDGEVTLYSKDEEAFYEPAIIGFDTIVEGE